MRPRRERLRRTVAAVAVAAGLLAGSAGASPASAASRAAQIAALKRRIQSYSPMGARRRVGPLLVTVDELVEAPQIGGGYDAPIAPYGDTFWTIRLTIQNTGRRAVSVSDGQCALVLLQIDGKLPKVWHPDPGAEIAAGIGGAFLDLFPAGTLAGGEATESTLVFQMPYRYLNLTRYFLLAFILNRSHYRFFDLRNG